MLCIPKNRRGQGMQHPAYPTGITAFVAGSYSALSLRGSPSTELRVNSATEAISCIDSFEIAAPRQVGARNDEGLL